MSNNSPIYERLDRAISNQMFYNDFNQCRLTYDNFTISDHAPMLFSSNQQQLTKPPLFRFQYFWVLDKESQSIIRKHWNLHVTGSCFFRVQQKLLRIKSKLKTWAKTKYRHTSNKLQANDENINELQTKLCD